MTSSIEAIPGILRVVYNLDRSMVMPDPDDRQEPVFAPTTSLTLTLELNPLLVASNPERVLQIGDRRFRVIEVLP